MAPDPIAAILPDASGRLCVGDMRNLSKCVAWLGALASLVAANASQAASLVAASGHGIYFNKPGANLDAYKSDVGECALLASYSTQAHAPGGPGLLDSVIAGLANGAADSQGLNANLENCMIVRRWRAVQVPPDEYATLAKADQGEILQALAQWVGSTTPHGAVIREWSNDAATKATRAVSIVIGFGRPTLGALVPANFWKAGMEKAPPGRPRYETPKGARTLSPDDLVSLKPGASAIVLQVRGAGATTGNKLILARIGADPSHFASQEDHQPDRIEAYQNALWASHGKVFAFEVPPGRWRIESLDIDGSGFPPISLNFCLGAPSFEVRPGQIVYAGDFDLSADALGPAFSQDLVKAWLGPKRTLGDRLQAADYSNGSTAPCRGTYLYALEVPGARFADGYAWGGFSMPAGQTANGPSSDVRAP